MSDPNTAVAVPQLPAFAGRTVLDVGAWDGYYSFLAERAGAARVVALDHYAWGVDVPARDRYWQQCREHGVLPDQTRDVTDFWQPDLPGKCGFDLARASLNSQVESLVADFTIVDLPALGTFDVVLYLGVLYHMKEPLTCLERLRAVTREVAVIETVAIRVPGTGHNSLLRFHSGGDLNRDFGNWYVPNIEALRALVLAAGFSRVEVVQGPPVPPPQSFTGALRRRLAPRREEPIVEYRAIVHAFV